MYPGADLGAPATKSDERVWIQNTTRPVLPEGFKGKEGVDYIGGHWVMVDATVYPQNADAPSKSEQIKIGDKTFWRLQRKKGPDLYYWKTDAHLYELYVYRSPEERRPIEEILDGIQEVKE